MPDTSDQGWSPPEPDQRWLRTERRPDGVTDDTVDAMGTIGEAVEWLERARGRLYDFHQMLGRVDLLLGDAVGELREAGHDDVADALDTHIVGRNVLEGRWTFQIVEEFEAVYWDAVRAFADHARAQLVGGERHVFESEMKDRRRTDGLPGHRRRPARDA